MNALPDQSAFTDAALEASMAAAALAQVQSDIARGVAWLIQEPWRANRIIPHAGSMDLHALAANVARRIPGASDWNRRMGLLQLRAALATEAFCDAWETYRADHCEVAS